MHFYASHQTLFHRVTIKPLQIGGQRKGMGGNGPFPNKQYHYFSSLDQECHISQPTTLLQMSIKAHWGTRHLPGLALLVWPTPVVQPTTIWWICMLLLKVATSKMYLKGKIYISRKKVRLMQLYKAFDFGLIKQNEKKKVITMKLDYMYIYK